MVRKLETGEYLAERYHESAPLNRMRAVDKEAEARHDGNKKALFKKM